MSKCDEAVARYREKLGEHWKGADEILFRAAWNEGAFAARDEINALHVALNELRDIERTLRSSSANKRIIAAIEAIESARLVSGSVEAAWAKQALAALRERSDDEGSPIGRAFLLGMSTARSEADKRVLTALRAIPEQDLKGWIAEPRITAPEAYEELARAELARREGGA